MTQHQDARKERRKQSRMHQQARQRQMRMRSIAFGAIVVGVLGIASALLITAFYKPSLPPMAGTVIDVSASMDGFDKSEIRIKAGLPVTVRLRSLDTSAHTDGGGKHQWAVDELGVSVVAQPLGTNYATFTPDNPGTYTFYCDICCGGRANPTMHGTLIVES